MKAGTGRKLARRAGSPENVQTTMRLSLHWFHDQFSQL
jgi:hypothetical protein